MKVRSALLALLATSLLLVAGCSSDSSDGGSASTTADPKTTTTEAADDGTTETTAADSGDGAPTEADLAVGIQEGFGTPAEQAECVAGELSGAGLNEASLQAIADANQDDLSDEDLASVTTAIQDAIAACP